MATSVAQASATLAEAQTELTTVSANTGTGTAEYFQALARVRNAQAALTNAEGE